MLASALIQMPPIIFRETKIEECEDDDCIIKNVFKYTKNIIQIPIEVEVKYVSDNLMGKLVSIDKEKKRIEINSNFLEYIKSLLGDRAMENYFVFVLILVNYLKFILSEEEAIEYAYELLENSLGEDHPAVLMLDAYLEYERLRSGVSFRYSSSHYM
jgi:hypothetical protein